MPTLTAEFAIDLISAANARELTRARIGRTRRHRGAGFMWMFAAARDQGDVRPTAPMTVTLTRVSTRRMDDDNLAYSFKSIRDGVADFLKLDDGDHGIAWRYEQRVVPRAELRVPRGQVGVKIVISWGAT